MTVSFPSMVKKEVFHTVHLYYIDELNGHRYVADRTINLACRWYQVVCDTDEHMIIQEVMDTSYVSNRKYYKSKDTALKQLE